eukprot:1147235-Pelagomonas_calceolata.AAC.1
MLLGMHCHETLSGQRFCLYKHALLAQQGISAAVMDDNSQRGSAARLEMGMSVLQTAAQPRMHTAFLSLAYLTPLFLNSCCISFSMLTLFACLHMRACLLACVLPSRMRAATGWRWRPPQQQVRTCSEKRWFKSAYAGFP